MLLFGYLIEHELRETVLNWWNGNPILFSLGYKYILKQNSDIIINIFYFKKVLLIYLFLSIKLYLINLYRYIEFTFRAELIS